MPLTTADPIAFIPTTDAAAARNFYETALGLNFVSDDNFALVFRVGSAQTMLRVVRIPNPSPRPTSPSSAGRSTTSTPPSPTSKPAASSSSASATSSRIPTASGPLPAAPR